jgi:hypothetical protein
MRGRSAPATQPEIIDQFNTLLDDMVDGRITHCPNETDIDQQTQDVLNLLGGAPMPKLPADIQACRIEFGRQLDGTHAAEEEEAMMKALGL